MRLLLLRHGQTTANVRGALDTAFPGHPLTDLGRAQAAAVPAALADEDVAAVYCSNLTRTRRTAEPLRAERGLSVGVRPGWPRCARATSRCATTRRPSAATSSASSPG